MCLGTIDLVSAWNHAEDMVAVSPLTTNVCMNCYKNNIMCHKQTVVLPLAMFFGDYLDGEVDGLVGEDSMATSWLGYEN